MEYENKKQEFLDGLNRRNNKQRQIKAAFKKVLTWTAIGTGIVVLGMRVWLLDNSLTKLTYKNLAAISEKRSIKKEILQTKEDIMLRENKLNIFENKKKYFGISTPSGIVKKEEMKLSTDQNKLTKYQRIENSLNKSKSYW
ncbi:MAG: hypothetical protein M1331_00160 [Candidatus Marsarchaeota archaeon]|nr:hypothetical protein [Candidatus Marsarchaeota archaeon]